MKNQGFRWRAFFQRSTDPLFLVNRQGYILFVNRAWEKLTGLSAAQARRLWCRRARLPKDRPPQWTDILGLVLSPPKEVLHGAAGRERRLVPAWEGRPAFWWDIEYLPLREQEGFRGLLGRIASTAEAVEKPDAGVPETIARLRQRRRHKLGELIFWRSFEDSSDPLFLLNRQGYVLFVNRAWERLTGLTATDAKRLWCRRTPPLGPTAEWADVIASLLTPPTDVFEGAPGHERRLVPAQDDQPARWWDIDFLPFRDANNFRGLFGRITPVSEAVEKPAAGVPETIVQLRQRRRQQVGDLFLSRQLPPLRRVAEQVALAGALRAPVLLVGAAGTGKETIARAIHLRGPERERAFAALDCRRLPPLAVGTLLFGEKGMLARAPVATLFLKGPDALPRELQRLLYEWLIGAEEHSLRLLAGCRDPDEALRQGRLLPELYHALATLRIDLPTLAERRDELPHLVDRLLRRLNSDGDRPAVGLSPDAWEVVLAYSWPGNLRQLFAVLQSARQHATSDMIDATDLPAYIRRAALPEQAPPAAAAEVTPLLPLLEKVERRLIELALRRAHGNQTQAADLLAVWRAHLGRRMEQLGIDIQKTPATKPKRGIKRRPRHRLSPPPTEESGD
jgi:DNA-binding NtrC family response regulator/PAS domain-containing protein